MCQVQWENKILQICDALCTKHKIESVTPGQSRVTGQSNVGWLSNLRFHLWLHPTLAVLAYPLHRKVRVVQRSQGCPGVRQNRRLRGRPSRQGRQLDIGRNSLPSDLNSVEKMGIVLFHDSKEAMSRQGRQNGNMTRCPARTNFLVDWWHSSLVQFPCQVVSEELSFSLVCLCLFLLFHGDEHVVLTPLRCVSGSRFPLVSEHSTRPRTFTFEHATSWTERTQERTPQSRQSWPRILSRESRITR